MKLYGLDIYTEKQQQVITQALRLATELHKGVYRKSGEAYITHPIAVAQFLINAHKDYQTVCIGLLHDTIEDTHITYNDLERIFGRTIAQGVEGVTKVKDLSKETATKDQIALATDRKFMNALVKDIRVIDVKLADRMHNMKTKEYWSAETQKRKARENFSVYIPVAKSIGAWRIKNYLEEFSFECLEPRYYALLQLERAKLIEQYQCELAGIAHRIRNKLEGCYHVTPHEIRFQYKTAYNLYEAIKIKNQKIFQLNDLLSLKFILEKPLDCYVALGVANDLYPCKEVTDYISNPKPNGYQSLHDIITCSDEKDQGKDILVKFRTKEMDLKATYGMSREDYRRKGGQKLFQGISLIDKTSKDDASFMDRVQKEIFGPKVTVFTPEGERCELAQGATVVDFAFYIHTDLGLHMRVALVNGMYVSNDYVLQDNDTIRIIPGKEYIGLDSLDSMKTFYAKQVLENRLLLKKKERR